VCSSDLEFRSERSMKMPDKLKNVSVSQTLGGAALLIGIVWIIKMAFDAIYEFDNNDPLEYMFFKFLAVPIFSIPGLFGSYYGYKLLTSTEKKYIKVVVGFLLLVTLIFIPMYTIPGCFAAYFVFKLIRTKERKFVKPSMAWMFGFVVMLAWEIVPQFLIDAYDESNIVGLAPFITVSVLFPAYVYLSMLVMKQDGLEPVEFKDFIGKGIIFLYAMILYGFLDSLFKGIEYTVPDMITTPILVEMKVVGGFIDSFLIFTPMVAAWLFYRFVMKKVDRLHVEEVILET